MAKRRKSVTMIVTVSVPREMSASDARREVRNLINHGAGWFTTPGYSDSVKCRAITPVKRKN